MVSYIHGRWWTRQRRARGAGELIEDATRRTHLANERTQLAWWRTGLTALAVALAIGRVVPELGGSPTRWPYTVVGAGFAVYGVGLILYGNVRSREVMEALADAADTPRHPRRRSRRSPAPGSRSGWPPWR